MKDCLTLFAICLMLASCNRAEVLDKADVDTGDFDNRQLNVLDAEEVRALIAKVDASDAEAAYRLYFLFTWAEKDWGFAYYWALKAKEMGHPLVDAAAIESAEGNIRARLLHIDDPLAESPKNSDLFPQ